jgi:hypothetical protein
VAVILLGAILGIGGLATLIAVTAKVLLPNEWTLDNLPPALAAKIAKSPNDYLPDDLRNVRAFRTESVYVRRYTANIKAKLARAEERVVDLKASTSPTTKEKQDLEKAERELATLKEGAALSDNNLSIYEASKWTILGEAGYRSVRDLFVKSGWLLLGAGAAAAFGATIYLLGLSYKPTEPKAEASTTTVTPRLAEVTRHSDGTSDAFWTAAGLGACQTGSKVTVLVDSGAGTTQEPYVVHTLAVKKGCPSEQFNVIDEVATITFPEAEIDICYRPIADDTTTTSSPATTTTSIANTTPTTKAVCPT